MESPQSLHSARAALHRVGVHIVARSRVEREERFSLRVTPGGFGTPDHGADGRRVRISGDRLIVESDAVGSPSARSSAIDGTTLRELAQWAGVDLANPLDVGNDTPELGDIDVALRVDVDGARSLASWYGDVAQMLDLVLAELPSSAAATLPRLWPEHFDVAIEANARVDRRVNLGGSPGDGFSAEPYLYVGPWNSDRPGSTEFWNAPFGATRMKSALTASGDDLIAGGAAFLIDGFSRLL